MKAMASHRRLPILFNTLSPFPVLAEQNHSMSLYRRLYFVQRSNAPVHDFLCTFGVNFIMATDFYGDFTLGILGGGQLGRMMIQEAINLNVDVHILDGDPNAPCKDICAHFQVGSLQDFDTVYHFGKSLDMLTIEIEKVNVDALEKLEEEGVLVYPQSRI